MQRFITPLSAPSGTRALERPRGDDWSCRECAGLWQRWLRRHLLGSPMSERLMAMRIQTQTHDARRAMHCLSMTEFLELIMHDRIKVFIMHIHKDVGPKRSIGASAASDAGGASAAFTVAAGYHIPP